MSIHFKWISLSAPHTRSHHLLFISIFPSFRLPASILTREKNELLFAKQTFVWRKRIDWATNEKIRYFRIDSVEYAQRSIRKIIKLHFNWQEIRLDFRIDNGGRYNATRSENIMLRNYVHSNIQVSSKISRLVLCPITNCPTSEIRWHTMD